MVRFEDPSIKIKTRFSNLKKITVMKCNIWEFNNADPICDKKCSFYNLLKITHFFIAT